MSEPNEGPAPLSDPVRLLARDSSRGYVSFASGALPRESEAVSESDQLAITRAAASKQIAAWQTSRRRLENELQHLTVHCRLSGIDKLARQLRRELAAFDRRVI